MNLTLYAKCGEAERAPRKAALTFPDILSDPLVRLVMKADGVDPRVLERELWNISALLPHRTKARASSEGGLPRAC